MSLWLSKEELIELTGYKRAGRQKLALGQMGLKFRIRPLDGFPLVDRWQFEGEIVRPWGKMWRQEPNRHAINGTPSATTRMLGINRDPADSTQGREPPQLHGSD
jgi:Domain of unknown function (DUF4224)